MKTENRNFGKPQMLFAYPHTRPISVTQLEHDILTNGKYKMCHRCRDFYENDICPECNESETWPILWHDIEIRDE
jgi:hypothetical protein